MSKHLTKIGNSLGVIISKTLMEILGWNEDVELDLRVDGDTLIARPVEESELDVLGDM